MSDLVPDPTQQDNRPAIYQNSRDEWIYRASAIGFCTKMLIAIRQGYQLKPIPKYIQDKMNESTLLEDEAIDKFIADHSMKISHIDRQVKHVRVKVSNNVFIRGKPDTEVGLTDGRTGIVEVKNLGDSLWKSNKVSVSNTYMAQGTIYMVGYDFLVFVFRNKDTGKMYYKWYDNTPLDFGSLFRKVKYIESQANVLELPEGCDVRQYPCPVFYLHESQRIEDWKDLSIQQDFEELARAYDEARKKEKTGKEEKRALQSELKAFRSRHMELTDGDGALESSRARLKRSEGSSKKFNETKLAWFLGQHGASIDDFYEFNSYDIWNVTWRG